MVRSRGILMGCVAVLACAAAAWAQDRPVTLESLLNEMADHAAVARWPQPEYTCRQASSYDRKSKTPADAAGWFANTDNMDGSGDSLRWETHQGRRECVLMDVDGPGAVVRFWTAGQPPKGKVRFYLDGAAEPAIEAPMFDLLAGKAFVPRPLAIENAGAAANLYLPIPYAKHCKVTYDEANPGNPNAPPPGRWYNIEYRTYAPGTTVKTFTMDDFRALEPMVAKVARTLLDPPAMAAGKAASLDTVVEPGKEAAVDLPAGPAAVRLLEVRLDAGPADRLEAALRSTVLRAAFDGEDAVWCPVGDFFGSGLGVNALQSWYRAVAKDGTLVCRWVMPYRESGRFSVLNLGTEKVTVRLAARVGDWPWDDRSMHFRANWRQERGIPTRPYQDWNYIAATGKGLYLGDTLALFNPVNAWWGEGDEKIRVDGEAFPSHFGTGSEDHYGYAWGNPAVFQGPFCNQPAPSKDIGHRANTRIRVLDAIPFTKSLKYDMEVWHWADCKVAYSVACYWYAPPETTTSIRGDPASAAEAIPLPGGPAVKIKDAIECETMKMLAKSDELKPSTQKDYPFAAGQWSQDAQLFVQATKPGQFVELLVTEGVTGPRKLTLYATRSHDYGILRFSVNGKKVEKEFDGWNKEPVLTGPVELGTFEPQDGRIVLRVEVVGTNPQSRGPKYYFGLDAVVLQKP